MPKPANFIRYPKRRIFDGPDKFEQLSDLLEDIDRHTLRAPINTPADLEIDPTGCLVKNGFALTPLALRQICKAVSCGLWLLISDISGIVPGSANSVSFTSPALAARIVNDCVRLRFHAVAGVRGRDLIHNHLTRTVDGMVGTRYRYLSNYNLLRTVAEILQAHDNPLHFHEGVLISRRMTVSFFERDPFAVTDTGEAYRGAYFSNSEAGESGVRGAFAVRIGDYQLLGPIYRIPHMGKEFVQKLNKLFIRVLRYRDKFESLQDNFIRKLPTKLDLLDDNKQINAAKRRKLESFFATFVDKRLAKDIIRTAIFQGINGTHIPAKISSQELASRRIRDIVLVASRVARKLYPDIRESLERSVFSFLIGSGHDGVSDGE